MLSPRSYQKRLREMILQKVREILLVDRISNLPDAVLHLILSYLPTKSAVKTSVLSKRWRYVWTKVPALDFTEMPAWCDSYKCLSLEQRIHFKSFVDKVLVHNDVSCVQRFCIDLYEVDTFYVNSWLSVAARREILELNIYLRWNSGLHFCLPTSILYAEKLVILKLKGHLIINGSMFFHFPNLETVHLEDLRFADDEFMRRLSSNCPVLRELHIVNCSGLTITFHVESLALKSLTMRGIIGACFVINTPNLRYISLHGHLSQFDIIGNMNLLIEADLDIEHCENDVDHRAENLLSKVSGVKVLRLGEDNFLEERIPVFRNLTCFHQPYVDEALCGFLNSAPRLKSLIISHIQIFSASTFDPDLAPKHLPCLESVDILEFCGFEDEISILAYILKAASALKELKIKMNLDTGIPAYESLLCLPRSSSVCQVITTRQD